MKTCQAHGCGRRADCRFMSCHGGARRAAPENVAAAAGHLDRRHDTARERTMRAGKVVTDILLGKARRNGGYQPRFRRIRRSSRAIASWFPTGLSYGR
jgi:hypothetical protein